MHVTLIEIITAASLTLLVIFQVTSERRRTRKAMARTPRTGRGARHEDALPPLSPGWEYREGLKNLDGSYRVNRGSW